MSAFVCIGSLAVTWCGEVENLARLYCHLSTVTPDLARIWNRHVVMHEKLQTSKSGASHSSSIHQAQMLTCAQIDALPKHTPLTARPIRAYIQTFCLCHQSYNYTFDAVCLRDFRTFMSIAVVGPSNAVLHGCRGPRVLRMCAHELFKLKPLPCHSEWAMALTCTG